jgi:hypothetical protein
MQKERMGCVKEEDGAIQWMQGLLLKRDRLRTKSTSVQLHDRFVSGREMTNLKCARAVAATARDFQKPPIDQTLEGNHKSRSATTRTFPALCASATT